MNSDDSPRTITRWTGRDKAGHIYKFGTLRLGAWRAAKVVQRVIGSLRCNIA